MSYKPNASRVSSEKLNEFVRLPIYPTTGLLVIPSVGEKTEHILHNNDIYTCPDLFHYFMIDLNGDANKLFLWLKSIGCPANHLNSFVNSVVTKMASEGHLYRSRPVYNYVKSAAPAVSAAPVPPAFDSSESSSYPGIKRDPPPPHKNDKKIPPIVPRTIDEEVTEKSAKESVEDAEEDELANWFAGLTYKQKLYMKNV